MRIYQGVDIVEISKFEAVMTRNDGLISDIFTDREKTYCLSFEDSLHHFAGRFAAKEAFFKAIGKGFSGIGIDHAFQEIEVLAGHSGQPTLFLSGWIEKISKKMSICQLTVSISHASNYCVANVILVGD